MALTGAFIRLRVVSPSLNVLLVLPGYTTSVLRSERGPLREEALKYVCIQGLCQTSYSRTEYYFP